MNASRAEADGAAPTPLSSPSQFFVGDVRETRDERNRERNPTWGPHNEKPRLVKTNGIETATGKPVSSIRDAVRQAGHEENRDGTPVVRAHAR